MVPWALMSFMATTVVKDANQKRTAINVRIKKRSGISRILLVPLRKSAEASMISIALFSESQLQNRQQAKRMVMIPETMVMAKSLFCLDLDSSIFD